MKYFYLFLSCIFVIFLILNQGAKAENIHFYDDIYKLKPVNTIEKSDITINEYYKNNENENHWTSRIEISYYPEVNNPIKYSNDAETKIENTENKLLLKFIRNKKQDIAIISYLENLVISDKAHFIYNILKYEKHPKKGMMVLKFQRKYPVNKTEDIVKIAKEVKGINDDYMERMIISNIPPIVEGNK